MPNNILITPGSASIQFSGSAANTIRLQVEPSGSIAFYGNSGSLFGISDSLSGSLMSVNDISGLPILEVFSDDRVVMGTYNQNTLVVTGSNVGIGTAVPSAKLQVQGNISASAYTSSRVSGVGFFGTSSFAVSASFAVTPAGTAGSSGTSGTSGSSGSSGSAGSSGTSGTRGSSGTSGANGSSGTSGTSGANGSSGTSGANGSSGTSGTSGANGSSGTSGTSGSSGTSGTRGSSGTSGTSGTNGSSGTSGTSGSSGTSGTSGSSGTSGTSGANGSSGTSGANGSSGTSGANGSSGTSGTRGSSGTSGANGSSGTSGTSATVTINGNVNDYVITATGTAATFQGEANLRFTGNSLHVTSSTADPNIILFDPTSGFDPYIRFVPSQSANTFALGIDDSDSDKFKLSYSTALGTNDRIVVDTTGNVGVGTTSPGTLLHVQGAYSGSTATFTGNVTAATLTGTLQTAAQANVTSVGTLTSLTVSGDLTIADKIVHSGDTNTTIRFAGNDTVTIETNGSERVRVDSSGNVGIGTTNPSRTLHVSSSAWDNNNGGGVLFDNSNSVGASLTLRPLASAVASGSNGWAVYAGGPGSAIGDGNFGFWAHATNQARLVIQRGGNVGIGTTSPAQLLHVAGDINVSTGQGFRINNTATSGQYLRGDGTRFVSSAIQAGDVPTLNQNTTGTAASAGTTTGASGQLLTKDDRIIEPNSINSLYLQFGFTSFANNNTSPWADYLHLRSYTDSSGGNDNLVVFSKSSIAMRIYQQTWNSGTAYSTYKDVAFTDSNITGTSANVTGTVAVANGGTGATSFTAGRILFGNGTSAINTSANLFWDNTNARLGIGTTSPGTQLEVYSTVNDPTIRVLTTGAGAWLQTWDVTSYYSGVKHVGANGTRRWITGMSQGIENYCIAMSDAGATNRFFLINTSGNVGIGTTDPTDKLTIQGTSLKFYTTQNVADQYTYIGTEYANGNGNNKAEIRFAIDGADTRTRIQFHTAGSGGNIGERMRIDYLGNVGIGTISNFDGSKLDVRDGKIVAGTTTSTNGSVTIQNYYSDGALSLWGSMYSSGGPFMAYGVKSSTSAANSFLSSTGIAVARGAYTIEGNVHRWYRRDSTTVAVDSSISMTQAMVLDSSGFLGINQTSPGARLHVEGAGIFKSDAVARVLYLRQSASNTDNIVQFQDQTSTNVWEVVGRNNQFYIYNNSLGEYSFYIAPTTNRVGIGNNTSLSYALHVTGTIYATGDVIAYSDARVKENVVTIDNALQKVTKMRGVYYTRKDEEIKKQSIGVIAQEVLEVVPELVSYAEDNDQYAVKYQNITALLIEAIKELKAEIDVLKQNNTNPKE